MYTPNYIKIIKSNDGSFILEHQYEVYDKKRKYEKTVSKMYTAKNINELKKKVSSLVSGLKSQNEEYEDNFDKAVKEE